MNKAIYPAPTSGTRRAVIYARYSSELLDVALSIPEEPADVELVVQDARAPQSMTADRSVGPCAASRTRNAFAIEFAGDGAGRLAHGEGREDTADDFRLGLVDDPPPAYGVAARVELANDISSAKLRSIEDQVRTCKARIEAEGWTLVATYTDYAQSGASHLRPGYQRLLADARGGSFDVLIAEALDRLSRDQEHIAALFKHLSFAH